MGTLCRWPWTLLGYTLLLGGILSWFATLLLTGCDERKQPRLAPTIQLGPVQSEQLFSAPLTAAARGPGRRWAAGTAKGEILLHLGRTKAPSLLPAREVHDGPLCGLLFTPDGKQLLSAGGKAVALWQLAEKKLVRQLRGPQQITALTFDPSSGLAYFGTNEGHVLRWTLKTSSAEPLAGFACAGSVVDRPRLKLPEAKRCPFGSYVEPDSGPPMCAYPVTALTLSQGRLIRSCREGTVGLLWLKPGRRDYYLAGHLSALAALDDGSLFFGRQDGELRLYDPQEKNVLATIQPPGKPVAAAAAGDFLAVAQQRALRLYLPPHPQPLASVPLAGRAIWLAIDLPGKALRLLTRQGRLLTIPFERGDRKAR